MNIVYSVNVLIDLPYNVGGLIDRLSEACYVSYARHVSVAVIRGRVLAAGVDRGPTAVAHVAAAVVAAGAAATRVAVRAEASLAATRVTARHAVRRPHAHIPEIAPRAEVLRENLAPEARAPLPRRQLQRSRKTGTNLSRKGRRFEGMWTVIMDVVLMGVPFVSCLW